MRKSRLLELIGSNAPCLLCQMAANKATERGLADLAFSMGQVALAVWSAGELSTYERASLNNELASLIRCVEQSGPDRAALAESLRPRVQHLALRSTPLAEVVGQFLAAFAEPNDSR